MFLTFYRVALVTVVFVTSPIAGTLTVTPQYGASDKVELEAAKISRICPRNWGNENLTNGENTAVWSFRDADGDVHVATNAVGFNVVDDAVYGTNEQHYLSFDGLDIPIAAVPEYILQEDDALYIGCSPNTSNYYPLAGRMFDKIVLSELAEKYVYIFSNATDKVISPVVTMEIDQQ